MRRPALLALPPLAGLVAVIAATGKGIYVSPDAVFYVGTARNWLDGRGFTPPPGLPPVDHFPPLFTVVLGLGRDPLAAARVVNALAFAGIVLLVGLVVRARTRSLPAALVASVLTAAAHDLLTYSASALSETLFLLLALSGLVTLAAHLEGPRPALLAGAAALVGAAVLTRYVAVALVVAGVAGLLWRRRPVDAAVFGVVSVAPVAAWLAGSGSGDRSVVFHPFGWDYLGQAVRPFARWLVPWPGPPVGPVLAVALVVAGAVLVRRHPVPADPRPALPGLLVAVSVVYLAVLLGYRTFTDASGRLDARFLLPLHVVAILLVVPALWRRPCLRPALALVVVAQVAGALSWTVGGLTDDSIARRGYTAAAWQRSTILDRLATADEPVYTNGFDAVFFHTGRPANPIPAERDYLTGRPNPRYAEELAAMRASGGLVAYFDALTFRRAFLPSRAELEAAIPLEPVLIDEVGTLYRLR